MTIRRVRKPTRDRFVADYLSTGTPVLVDGEMSEWGLSTLWTPDHLKASLGAFSVQIYTDYFDLVDVCPLSEYINRYFGATRPRGPVPYVRWYTKLKAVDFYWADDAFKSFAHQWRAPSFLPDTDLLLPFCTAQETADPTATPFPAKGLFVSAAGARTRLHVDPWASDAVLVQIYGRKRWTLFDPTQKPYLTNADGTRFLDISNPDSAMFPNYACATPTVEFVQHPGQIVFVPRGWYHQVETITDSISLTWSFVPLSGKEAFLRYLNEAVISASDLDVMRYFFSLWLPPNATVRDIGAFVSGLRVTG